MMPPPFNGDIELTGTGQPPNPGSRTCVEGWNVWQDLCGLALPGAINDLQNLPFTPGELVL
jgi:hypothetical protein